MAKALLMAIIGLIFIVLGNYGLEAGSIAGIGRHSKDVLLKDQPNLFYSIIFIRHYALGGVAIMYSIYLIVNK